MPQTGARCAYRSSVTSASRGSPMTSGYVRRSAVVFITAAVVLLAGCGRGVLGYGFAGGGLPPHVRTVAVIPFDNQTTEPTVTRELADQLVTAFEQRLGLRLASEDRADAVVRGTITRFDPDVPVAYSADPDRSTTARRRLVVSVDVEVIDQVTGEVLWRRQGMTQEGEYAERESELGVQEAVERIVNDIVEGAQSQW